MPEFEVDQKELEMVMDEFRASLQAAKPKIQKIQQKIRNKEPLTEEQKRIMLKFKRAMDVMQELKTQGILPSKN